MATGSVRVPMPAAAPALGTIKIPFTGAKAVEMRFAPITSRDTFNPSAWRSTPLTNTPAGSAWFEVDLNALKLDDGAYEYEFTSSSLAQAAPDPYAEEITRFGGYRGVFHIKGGQQVRPAFSWADEIPQGAALPNNNQMVIYELPLRWTSDAPDNASRQIALGDFDRLIFARLDSIADLGVNAIELLPVQDSADTLNWGYGTRFFFAPDIDMGTPVDTKLFIKKCHQRGIRVILDVVMNHARECPLEQLAWDRYFLNSGAEEGGRPSWEGKIFRYRTPAADGSYPARELQYRMAEYWIREYHIDGFRVDEFKGIDNWDFVQQFRETAWGEHMKWFPSRPFTVIAEDSWQRNEIAQNAATNPNGKKVVDALWNFAFRDDFRRLLRNQIFTQWGQPSRRERIAAMLAGWQTWNNWDHSFKPGFGDMSETVNYVTSHDVEKEGEQRFMNFIFGDLLRLRWLGSGSVENVRTILDNLASADDRTKQAHQESLDRAGSAFALLLTSVGMPMFLAGEEFADVHDLEHTDRRLKMSDPVDWSRAEQPGHKALRNRVRDLIRLRTSHAALHRNEIEFLHFHPAIDENDGIRVFEYCRTGGKPVGSQGQVVVLANCGPHDFPTYDVPWPWTGSAVERGTPLSGSALTVRTDRQQATLSLAPFQVRVFTT